MSPLQRTRVLFLTCAHVGSALATDGHVSTGHRVLSAYCSQGACRTAHMMCLYIYAPRGVSWPSLWRNPAADSLSQIFLILFSSVCLSFSFRFHSFSLCRICPWLLCSVRRLAQSSCRPPTDLLGSAFSLRGRERVAWAISPRGGKRWKVKGQRSPWGCSPPPSGQEEVPYMDLSSASQCMWLNQAWVYEG